MRVFAYMFVYAHIWFDDSEVGWWLRLWRWSGGQKSGGGQRQSSHYGGRVVCESGGWAALIYSLWGGRDLRLTWGCGVW